MKKGLLFAMMLFVVAGCAGGVKKNFTVVTDPPDADIKIVSEADRTEQKYSSPARIMVKLPKDHRLQAKISVEVSRDAYKPWKVSLRDVREGETLNVKLEKIVHYLLKYRMIGPVQSEEMKFQDKIISISLGVNDRSFLMSLTNLTQHELKILWDRAEYTDVNNRPRRLMHAGVRFQDRNNPIPAQVIPARGSVQQAVMPATSVVYSEEKKAYENLPLFPLDSETAALLKGRVFYLFIPIEIDRQIIPYNFKFEITDAVKG